MHSLRASGGPPFGAPNILAGDGNRPPGAGRRCKRPRSSRTLYAADRDGSYLTNGNSAAPRGGNAGQAPGGVRRNATACRAGPALRISLARFGCGAQRHHVSPRVHNQVDLPGERLKGALFLVVVLIPIVGAANAGEDVPKAALGMIRRHASAAHERARAAP